MSTIIKRAITVPNGQTVALSTSTDPLLWQEAREWHLSSDVDVTVVVKDAAGNEHDLSIISSPPERVIMSGVSDWEFTADVGAALVSIVAID